MMTERTHNLVNRLPLHLEASEMLAREIQAGILTDGTRLPPERTMARELGISVGTLRKALLDLSEKGLIESVHGSGNYVRINQDKRSSNARFIYDFFRLERLAGGGLPTAEVLSVRKVRKPSGTGIAGDNLYCHRIRRLRRLNGIDAALEEIWVDAGPAMDIRREELHDSLYLYYKEKLGIWISRAEDSISVQVPPSWMPDTFGTTHADRTRGWGYIERRSFDAGNVCVEFSRTWFDPQSTRYVARWK
jgi:GntR family transcriptional regulator